MTIAKEFEYVIDSRLLWAITEVRSLVPQLQDNRVEHPFHRKLGICGNVFGALVLQGVTDTPTPDDVTPDYVLLMNGLRKLIGEYPTRDRSSDFYPVDGYEEYVSESRLGKLWFNKRRLEMLDYLVKACAEQVERQLTAELLS